MKACRIIVPPHDPRHPDGVISVETMPVVASPDAAIPVVASPDETRVNQAMPVVAIPDAAIPFDPAP
jgi:hypothetical protein